MSGGALLAAMVALVVLALGGGDAGALGQISLRYPERQSPLANALTQRSHRFLMLWIPDTNEYHPRRPVPYSQGEREAQTPLATRLATGSRGERVRGRHSSH